MRFPEVDDRLLDRLHRRSDAQRWDLSRQLFAEALQASAARAFAGKEPTQRDLERYFDSLHLEDLALACACAAGNEVAWEHFVRAHRPSLYRAADAAEPGGGARELADSLYADLYGLDDRHGKRQSLFRYFHGRSSLKTWLRAVLAQRQIDRVRAGRRIDSLPEDESRSAIAAAAIQPHPDRARYLALMNQALGRALARLESRDRLRLGCYYAQGLKLAHIGRLLKEHEATVSRQLARSRRTIRADVEHQLRVEARLSDAEIAECFECVMQDAGPIDLDEMFGPAERKKSAGDRSI